MDKGRRDGWILGQQKEFQKIGYTWIFLRRLCAQIFDDLWGVWISHPAVGRADFLGEMPKMEMPHAGNILNCQIEGHFVNWQI
jgi:hypothetical protein